MSIQPKRPAEKSEEERLKQQKKEAVLTRGTPSLAGSVAQAVVIKNRDIFFLCEPGGDVPMSPGHGLGLYYHDCRYLNGYRLRMNGAAGEPLASIASRGFEAVLQLTNPTIRLRDGSMLAEQTIGLRLTRVLDAQENALHDVLTLRNFHLTTLEVTISLDFAAAFEDIFEVRGLFSRDDRPNVSATWHDGTLFFLVQGRDSIYRSTCIHCWTKPDRTENESAYFDLLLKPQQEQEVFLSIVAAESNSRSGVEPCPHSGKGLDQLRSKLESVNRHWLSARPRLETGSLALDRTVNRSLLDLRVLRSRLKGKKFYAAGVPWFATLFGRDSIITCLQSLAFDWHIAEHTLLLLAQYQGRQEDAWKDEQPGKILHEIRLGELTTSGQIPCSPYYGSIDSTILFLILAAEYVNWSGNLGILDRLGANIEAALSWAARYGDMAGTAWLAYDSIVADGLINQGWKDSGDAIVNEDGSLAEPPIALVEVQAYAYLAKISIASLFERIGQKSRAAELRAEAELLKSRFNSEYWLPEKEFYALALQKGGRPATVISSNPGQALWTGIVDAEKAGKVVSRLLAEDMYSGWGVRTLSSKERRYNPSGYHLGTVWPHDNSIIAAGFRRYGFDEEALQIFEGTWQAATYFEQHRLPEVFSGFHRSNYGAPVHYPVACHPQAWAAGSIPFLLVTLLGLKADALDQRLLICNPILPPETASLTLTDLHIGHAVLSLHFERTTGGSIAVRVLQKSGKIDVVLDPRSVPG